jgi:hypothetical protein
MVEPDYIIEIHGLHQEGMRAVKLRSLAQPDLFENLVGQRSALRLDSGLHFFGGEELLQREARVLPCLEAAQQWSYAQDS